jgi:hypothetical protein
VLLQTKLEQAVPLSTWKSDVCIISTQDIKLLEIPAVVVIEYMCICEFGLLVRGLIVALKINSNKRSEISLQCTVLWIWIRQNLTNLLY